MRWGEPSYALPLAYRRGRVHLARYIGCRCSGCLRLAILLPDQQQSGTVSNSQSGRRSGPRQCPHVECRLGSMRCGADCLPINSMKLPWSCPRGLATDWAAANYVVLDLLPSPFAVLPAGPGWPAGGRHAWPLQPPGDSCPLPNFPATRGREQ